MILLFGLVIFCLMDSMAVGGNTNAASAILIKNVNVWDGTSDSVKKGIDMLVEANMIKKVAKGIKAPGAEVILWDGNPLGDLETLKAEQKFKLVIKDGKIYKNTL